MPSKMTKKIFQNKINELYPDEEILILDYNKASDPCEYKCLNCGNNFKIYRAGDLLRKKHCCNFCFQGRGHGEKTKLYKEEIISFFKKKNDLTFLEFGYNEKIHKNTVVFLCNNCKNKNSKTILQFKESPFCSYCTYNARKRNEQGLQARLPEDYILLGTYEGNDTKTLFKHKCGFCWKTTPHNLLSGYGCPKCSKKSSKGEIKIIQFLQKRAIAFEKEKTFAWLNKKRFDFYLPEYNLIIEYMGIQHYKEIAFFGSLEKIKENDFWKKEQCLKHGLEYLEISYLDFDNIEKILVQRLNIGHPNNSDEDIV